VRAPPVQDPAVHCSVCPPLRYSNRSPPCTLWPWRTSDAHHAACSRRPPCKPCTSCITPPLPFLITCLSLLSQPRRPARHH
jgi:hypothetical protein